MYLIKFIREERGIKIHEESLCYTGYLNDVVSIAELRTELKKF